MRKLITCLLILLFLTSAAGCGKSTDTNNTDSSVAASDAVSKENVDVDSSKPFEGKLTEEILRNYKVAPASDFEWEVKDDGVWLKKYLGNDAVVVVPDTIEGKAVVGIPVFMFANNDNIVGVMFPETIKKVTISCFQDCEKLQVVIAEGAEVVESSAFLNSMTLREVHLSKKLYEIELNAFLGCSKLEKLYIPATVTNIVEDAPGLTFYSCQSLTIYGEAGSFIEQYCKDNNIPFQAE